MANATPLFPTLVQDGTGLEFSESPATTTLLSNVESDPERSPICALSKECLASYQALCGSLRDTTTEAAEQNGYSRAAALAAMQDARSRFKAWASNIAAFQDMHLKSSLDFRLRLDEAAEIRERILKVLENLNESLEDASLIVTGVESNETWGALSDSEEDEGDEGSHASQEEAAVETTELDQLFSAIKSSNSTLMKLSIVIRNSPVRDDYLKAASRYSYDPKYDIGHVKEKHYSEKTKNGWLIDRLGKAITRRRAFLKYREEHHSKLTKDWDDVISAKAKEEQPQKSEGTLALTKHTKATTFIGTKAVIEKDGSEAGSFGSQTSYEQTIAGEGAEARLTVPPPPQWAFEDIPFEYGHPFQCPLCYTEQTVKNRAAWKKHVFRDLKPYVCTFQGCNLRMFKSRNEWFSHELQVHRREYTCESCVKTFSKKETFSLHLSQEHSSNLIGSALEAMILQSEEPVDRIYASACLICDEWRTTLEDPKQNSKRLFLNDGKEVEPYGTLSQFRRHLGRHMEQLALFALPMNDDDGMEDDSADGDGESDSDHTMEEHSPEPSLNIALDANSENEIDTISDDLETQRYTVISLLSSAGPLSEFIISGNTNTSFEDLDKILPRVATYVSKATGIWELRRQVYKTLDFWNPKFPANNRDDVVYNAISYFDEIQLPWDHPAWDRLLPVEERGRGTILSRLPRDPAKSKIVSSDIEVSPPDSVQTIDRDGQIDEVAPNTTQIDTTDLASDIRLELEGLDAKQPPGPGQRSLVEEFDLNISREEGVDTPSRKQSNALDDKDGRNVGSVDEDASVSEHRSQTLDQQSTPKNEKDSEKTGHLLKEHAQSVSSQGLSDEAVNEFLTEIFGPNETRVMRLDQSFIIAAPRLITEAERNILDGRRENQGQGEGEMGNNLPVARTWICVSPLSKRRSYLIPRRSLMKCKICRRERPYSSRAAAVHHLWRYHFQKEGDGVLDDLSTAAMMSELQTFWTKSIEDETPGVIYADAGSPASSEYFSEDSLAVLSEDEKLDARDAISSPDEEGIAGSSNEAHNQPHGIFVETLQPSARRHSQESSDHHITSLLREAARHATELQEPSYMWLLREAAKNTTELTDPITWLELRGYLQKMGIDDESRSRDSWMADFRVLRKLYNDEVERAAANAENTPSTEPLSPPTRSGFLKCFCGFTVSGPEAAQKAQMNAHQAEDHSPAFAGQYNFISEIPKAPRSSDLEGPKESADKNEAASFEETPQEIRNDNTAAASKTKEQVRRELLEKVKTAKAKEEADAKAAADNARQDEEEELERQIQEWEDAEAAREKAEAELAARKAVVDKARQDEEEELERQIQEWEDAEAAREEAEAELAARKAVVDKARQDEEEKLERQFQQMEGGDKEEAELDAGKAITSKSNPKTPTAEAEKLDRKLEEVERQMERLEDEKERKRVKAERETSGAYTRDAKDWEHEEAIIPPKRPKAGPFPGPVPDEFATSTPDKKEYTSHEWTTAPGGLAYSAPHGSLDNPRAASHLKRADAAAATESTNPRSDTSDTGELGDLEHGKLTETTAVEYVISSGTPGRVLRATSDQQFPKDGKTQPNVDTRGKDPVSSSPGPDTVVIIARDKRREPIYNEVRGNEKMVVEVGYTSRQKARKPAPYNPILVGQKKIARDVDEDDTPSLRGFGISQQARSRARREAARYYLDPEHDEYDMSRKGGRRFSDVGSRETETTILARDRKPQRSIYQSSFENRPLRARSAERRSDSRENSPPRPSNDHERKEVSTRVERDLDKATEASDRTTAEDYYFRGNPDRVRDTDALYNEEDDYYYTRERDRDRVIEVPNRRGEQTYYDRRDDRRDRAYRVPHRRRGSDDARYGTSPPPLPPVQPNSPIDRDSPFRLVNEQERGREGAVESSLSSQPHVPKDQEDQHIVIRDAPPPPIAESRQRSRERSRDRRRHPSLERKITRPRPRRSALTERPGATVDDREGSIYDRKMPPPPRPIDIDPQRPTTTIEYRNDSSYYPARIPPYPYYTPPPPPPPPPIEGESRHPRTTLDDREDSWYRFTQRPRTTIVEREERYPSNRDRRPSVEREPQRPRTTIVDREESRYNSDPLTRRDRADDISYTRNPFLNTQPPQPPQPPQRPSPPQQPRASGRDYDDIRSDYDPRREFVSPTDERPDPRVQPPRNPPTDDGVGVSTSSLPGVGVNSKMKYADRLASFRDSMFTSSLSEKATEVGNGTGRVEVKDGTQPSARRQWPPPPTVETEISDGWWRCSEEVCNRKVDSEIWGTTCPDCGHSKCPNCELI